STSTSCAVAIRTTSSRPSTRPSPAPCGRPSKKTPEAIPSPAPRESCEHHRRRDPVRSRSAAGRRLRAVEHRRHHRADRGVLRDRPQRHGCRHRQRGGRRDLEARRQARGPPARPQRGADRRRPLPARNPRIRCPGRPGVEEPADVLEQLLLETVSAEDVEGSIRTDSMTKLQASAATMTPGRAAVARTALLWIIAAVLAGLVTAFGIALGLGGNTIAWVVAGFGVIVLGFSLWRIWSVLSRGAK